MVRFLQKNIGNIISELFCQRNGTLMVLSPDLIGVNIFWKCPLLSISHSIRAINYSYRVIVQRVQSPNNYSHSPGGLFPQNFSKRLETWFNSNRNDSIIGIMIIKRMMDDYDSL